MGLSEPVTQALPHAVRAVEEILAQAAADEAEAGRLTGEAATQGREVWPVMLSRLIRAIIVAAVLAMVIESLPDIKRYLELREM